MIKNSKKLKVNLKSNKTHYQNNVIIVLFKRLKRGYNAC